MSNNVDQTLGVENKKQDHCFSPQINSVFESAVVFHERAEYFRNVERPKWRREKRNNRGVK